MKYDAELCERLIAEARQHDAEMGDFVADPDHRPDSAVWFMRSSRPENARGIEWMRKNLRTMADQIEAAQREIERMRPVVDVAEALADRWPGASNAAHEIYRSIDDYRAVNQKDIP